MSSGLGPLFDRGLQYARAAHRDRQRRGAPMFAHLMRVAGLVLESGGDEEEAVAALLHDAAEDAGGRERLEDIRRHFGDRVARIVEECTDTFDEEMDWLEKKRRYLEHLAQSGSSGRLVSCADKLCNVRQLNAALRKRGGGAWQDYEGGCSGRLWYYNELLQHFRQDPQPAMLADYEQAVRELNDLASGD